MVLDNFQCRVCETEKEEDGLEDLSSSFIREVETGKPKRLREKIEKREKEAKSLVIANEDNEMRGSLLRKGKRRREHKGISKTEINYEFYMDDSIYSKQTQSPFTNINETSSLSFRLACSFN